MLDKLHPRLDIFCSNSVFHRVLRCAYVAYVRDGHNGITSRSKLVDCITIGDIDHESLTAIPIHATILLYYGWLEDERVSH